MIITPSYQWTEQTAGLFADKYDSNRATQEFDEVDDYEDMLTIEAGYMNVSQQIQNMILSGEKLNSSRAFDEDIKQMDNDDFAMAVAQIRHPNTDITEIKTYTEEVNAKIAACKSVAEKHAAEQSIKLGDSYKSYEQKENPDWETPPTSGTDPTAGTS